MEMKRSPGEEAEALLRAATKLALEESNENQEAVIHVTIKGSGAWKIDADGVRETAAAEASRARLHLTYASADVFLGLAHKRMNPRTALITGRLSFRGDMALGIRMGKSIHKAVELQAHHSNFEIAQRDRWQRDEDAPACAVCGQAFQVYRRRHHCRYCGRVVCAACSPSLVEGQRACEPCRARAAKIRPTVAPKIEGSKVSSPAEPSVPRERVEILKRRVCNLEEQVETLDRRVFTDRALMLKQVVLFVYRLIAVLAVTAMLLAAHLFAGFLSWQVGPSVFQVAVVDVTPLFAFVKVASWVGAPSVEAVITNASAFPENDADEAIAVSDFPCTPYGDRRGGGFSGTISEEHQGRTDEEGTCGRNNGRRREDDIRGTFASESKSASRPLTISLSMYWPVMIIIVALMREHHRKTEGLFLRRIKTFCFAGTAVFLLRLTRRITKDMNPSESDEAWTDIHKLLAPFMYHSILDIAGMWVKTGQYLSSRADVMPQPYLDELAKLQDAVPPSSYEEVEETVLQQLGRPMSELFASIEKEALASASVAQVHRCTLKDGRKAVIKVQHRRVRQLFLEDLRNIRRLVNWVAWTEKEYDFRPIMNEWAKESNKELDFYCEANNLHRIHAAMKRSGLEVIVPELIPEFTRMKVVVMTFCEGFKVTDAAALAAAELDRDRVMRAVTESFAYQIHIDGLFNGDPHPGNILLQTKSSEGGPSGGQDAGEGKLALPVLLDWGLAKTLSERLRIAFSRFVYAASEHDFVSMLQSFEEMGVKLNRFDPAEDMRNMRFLLRDTKPPSEARADSVKFLRRMKKKKAKGLKQPVDAYPGDLLFFLRVHELLRGLAARLKVRQKYIDIMAPYAKRALIEMVPEAEHATRAIFPSPLLSPIEAKVRRVLEELVEGGQITGCQVCVIYRGQMLVDLSAGRQGPIDHRPVKPSTVFCVFSAGKAVCSTAVHILVDRGQLRYDQRVADLWPEFARNGKEDTTVRHILTHSTGLQHAFPEKPTFGSVSDWGKMQRMLEEAVPAWPPGSRASYHYFTFGWLVAAVVEKASGVPFEEFVRQEIAIPLGLEDSFYMGRLHARGVPEDRIASVEHAFSAPGSIGGASSSGDGGDGNEGIVSIEDLEISGTESEDEAAQSGFLGLLVSAIMENDPAEAKALQVFARKLVGREYFLDPRVFNYRQMRDACLPSANGFFTAKALARLYDNFLESLDIGGGVGEPRPVLLSRERVNEMRTYQVKETSALHVFFNLPARGIRYALGYQMFGFREKTQPQAQHHRSAYYASSSGSVVSTNTGIVGSSGRSGPAAAEAASEAVSSVPRERVRLSGFGHVGMGGSVALCDPASGLAFAMVTNKVATGRISSLALLNLVCEELGLGDPSHFFLD